MYDRVPEMPDPQDGMPRPQAVPNPPQQPVPQHPVPQQPVSRPAPQMPAQPQLPHGDELAVEARLGRGIGQMLALGFGIALLILGGTAISQTGFNFLDVANQHANVAGFHTTSLMAVIHIIAGIALVSGGARPSMQWTSMRIGGAIALAFGGVMISEPPALHTVLGAHATTGWLYAGIGVVLLVVSIVYPMIVADRSLTN